MSNENGQIFESSPTFAALTKALAKAQGEMTDAERSGINPDIGKSYADLASVRKACAAALAKNGLAVIQIPKVTPTSVEVKTMLAHDSGEWIAATMAVAVERPTIWAIGSFITYLRRYGYALVGVVSEVEDDGAAAMRPSGGEMLLPKRGPQVAPPQSTKTDALKEELNKWGKADTAAKAHATTPKQPPTQQPEQQKPAPKPEAPKEAPKQEIPKPAPKTEPPKAAEPPVQDNLAPVADWLKAIGTCMKGKALTELYASFNKQSEGFTEVQAKAVRGAFKAKGYEMGKFFISNAKTAQECENAEAFCNAMFVHSDPHVDELSSSLAVKLSEVSKGQPITA